MLLVLFIAFTSATFGFWYGMPDRVGAMYAGAFGMAAMYCFDHGVRGWIKALKARLR